MSSESNITATHIAEATERLQLDVLKPEQLADLLDSGKLNSTEVVAVGLIAGEQREAADTIGDKSGNSYDLLAGMAVGRLFKMGDATNAGALWEQVTNV